MICENRKRCRVFGLAFWVSEPILAIGKVENPSELPLEFKCRKAKAVFGASLSVLPLAAPTQHA